MTHGGEDEGELPSRGYPTWAVAGLTRRDGSGVMDRLLPTVQIWNRPAEVWIDDGVVSWRTARPEADEPKRVARPDERLFESFLDLADAPDSSIASFFRRWGAFEVCEHGLGSRPLDDRSHEGDFAGAGDADASLPASACRHLARQLNAVLNVAARLHVNQYPAVEDWALLIENPEGVEAVRQRRRGVPNVEYLLLSSEVTRWLSATTVPTLRWERNGPPSFALQPGGPVGTAVLHAAFAIARTDGLAICAACGRPFVPSGRRPRGQRTYCKTCGLRAAQRDAARDYRARLRREKEQ